MRSPLPHKEIQYTDWQMKDKKNLVYDRVLFFDPTSLYNRLGDKINPYDRHAGLSMEEVFPKTEEKICSCGCDLPVKVGATWHRKWATYECQKFASDVLSIINNYFGVAGFYISLYYGKKCSGCGNEKEHQLELDHIIGVKQGGGGCWLSNYRWLCKACHVDKTNRDFGRKNYKKTNQLSLLP